jgi:hypothetical protein
VCTSGSRGEIPGEREPVIRDDDDDDKGLGEDVNLTHPRGILCENLASVPSRPSMRDKVTTDPDSPKCKLLC